MATRHIGAQRIVADLRKQKRGTSKRLAYAAGISTGAVSQVRRGYRMPSESVAASVGYRKIILWIRDEELALADKLETELAQPSKLKEGG